MSRIATRLIIGMFAWLIAAPMILAQDIPAIPVAPAAPAGAAGIAGQAGQVAGQAGQAQNIWSKIFPTEQQCARLKKCLCSSSIVQALGAMMRPVTAMSGGMIKGFCPTPEQAKIAEDLKKPADSAGGAAARIKQDEAEAKERRADVRFLGTVDCSRFPEAEKALINALRTDRNECVRLEAAMVLGHGCCCTKAVVNALQLTATGSDKDGNPKERSQRVRDAATCSLNACGGVSPEPPEKALPLPAKVGAEAVARVEPIPRVEPTPPSGLLQAVFKTPMPATTPPTVPPPTDNTNRGAVPAGQRGLFDIVRRNFGS